MTEKTTTEKTKKRQKSTPEKAAAKPSSGNRITSNKLKLLVTIVNRNKAEFYADLIQSFEVNMQVAAFGHGTADAKTLMFLGINSSEKAVIFSVIQQKRLPDALHELEEKFNTIRDGKGIAFTIPLSSVIGTLIYRFLSNNRMEVKEGK